MIEYIKAQKEADEAIINNSFTVDELHRFSKSDSRWVSNKGKSYQTRKIKKGEIYIKLNLVKILLLRCHMNIGDW